MDSGLFSLTKTLVDTPSENPPGAEAAVVERLEDYLYESTVPFDIEVYDVEPGRPNLIASVGDPAGGTILYTGHLDVVPADRTAWTRDPFDLHRAGDRIVGRGVSDMKGAVAAIVRAVEALWRDHRPDGEMLLAFVMGEETGGIGSEALVKRGIDADLAVLGEPTELEICAAQMGVVRYRITIEGRSCHASVPDQGINALVGAGRVLSELEKFDQGQRTTSTHDLLPPETVTPTLINGGTSANVVPRTATLHVDWRIHPGPVDPRVYDRQLNKVVEAATAETPFRTTVNRYRFIPGLDLATTSRIVDLLSAATADVGIKSPVTGFPATTDARYFVKTAGIPTAIFGPGSIARDAHTVDESIRVADLETAFEVYYRSLQQFFDTKP